MNLRHPLHEFMPYGAPDLLVAHRPDLSRALTVSAFAVFSLFAAAAFLSTHAPRRIEPGPRVVELLPSFRAPAIRFVPPSGPPKVAVRPASRFAMPKPVVEDTPQTTDLPPEYEEYAKQVQKDGGTGPPSTPSDAHAEFTHGEDADLPVAAVDSWPVAVTVVKPEYPSIARDAMVEDLVIVLVLVGRDGRVRDVKIDEHHHSPLLDEAARDAAKKWVFSPALVNDHPVAVWTAIPFKFVLQ